MAQSCFFITRVQAVFCLHMVCFNSYRLADHPELSEEFTKHLKRLPQGSSTDQERALYRRLIDTYGTHYIHQVRRSTEIHICLKDQCVEFGLIYDFHTGKGLPYSP